MLPLRVHYGQIWFIVQDTNAAVAGGSGFCLPWSGRVSPKQRGMINKFTAAVPISPSVTLFCVPLLHISPCS